MKTKVSPTRFVSSSFSMCRLFSLGTDAVMMCRHVLHARWPTDTHVSHWIHLWDNSQNHDNDHDDNGYRYPGIYSTTSKTEIGSIGWNERMNEFEYAKMEAGRGNTHESSTVQRMYFKRHGLGTQGVKYQAKHTFLDLPGSPSRNGGHADLPISSVRPRLNGNRTTQSRQPGANRSM